MNMDINPSATNINLNAVAPNKHTQMYDYHYIR